MFHPIISSRSAVQYVLYIYRYLLLLSITFTLSVLHNTYPKILYLLFYPFIIFYPDSCQIAKMQIIYLHNNIKVDPIQSHSGLISTLLRQINNLYKVFSFLLILFYIIWMRFRNIPTSYFIILFSPESLEVSYMIIEDIYFTSARCLKLNLNYSFTIPLWYFKWFSRQQIYHYLI